MALSKQSRNILIGGGIAIVIIAILAYLIGRGCDQEETRTTPTTTTDTTATQTTPTVTQTETVTVPAPPEPGPTPPAPAPPPAFVSRSVSPEVADPGDTLMFSSELTGIAVSVTITVFKRDTGDLAMTLPLTKGATVGDVTTWSLSAAAPTVKGEYRYFASATGEGGEIVEMPGVSGWTFCVGDPLVDCP